jgi:DNA-binding IscR family transcriptional regulator
MEKKCPMSGHWNPVNKAIRAALEAVTLHDMVNDISMQIKNKPAITQRDLGAAQ